MSASRSHLSSTLRRWWLAPLATIVLLFLLTPVFIVIPMSFSASNYLSFPPDEWSMRWYRTYFSSPEWMAATRTSLSAAGCTVVLSLPIGFFAAYFLMTARKRAAAWMFGFLLLPQIVPVILLAIGIFFLYIWLGLVNSFVGIVLAHTALAIPFVVTTIGAGLKQFDRTLEFAAQSLGATRLRAIRDVILPQIRLPLLAAAVFAFVTSLDEVVIGLFVAGGDNTVLTRKMFLALRDQVDPTIAAISTQLILISLFAVAVFLIIGRSGVASEHR
jgi:putative spermidine/putrescine transport system permease protein